jgi:hypothetical protein
MDNDGLIVISCILSSLFFIVCIHNWSYPNAPYKHFFNTKIYLLSLVGSALLGAIAYHWLSGAFVSRLLFEPTIFLMLFKLADWLSLKVNKRHIILMYLSRSEFYAPQPGENIIDFIRFRNFNWQFCLMFSVACNIITYK